MIKFFKQLFCRHNFKYDYSFIGEEPKKNKIIPLRFYMDKFRCNKCGKEIERLAHCEDNDN